MFRSVRTDQFGLPELHYQVRTFAFLKGEKAFHRDPEDPANENLKLLRDPFDC